MPELTLPAFKQMRSGDVFAEGQVANSPQGVYMTEQRKGDPLIWVAKKGHGDDWVIYTAWAEQGIGFCLTNGQKISTEAYIRKLVPCTDEVYHRYRQ